MNDPQSSKSGSKQPVLPDHDHWYTLQSPTPLEPPTPPTDRTGRARQRRDRRSNSDPRPVSSQPRGLLPRLNPSHLVIAVAVLLVFGFFLFISNLIGRTTPGTGSLATRTLSSGAAVASTVPAIPLDIKPWDGKGRFTLLLMGLDSRPDETLRQARSDTMILLSLDPATKTAGILSIPRDLFVPIPGESDMQRINAAYVVGELRKPGGGPALAMQTLQYNLGIKVNAYAAVTFETVITLVDSVGGIDINVPIRIDDEEYPDLNYGYAPLHIAAGQQHMDGDLALKYARTRHQTDDFDRTKRQQQVLLALRESVTKLNMLPQLVTQAPALWTQLQSGFSTDLSLDQILSLAVYARDIPLDKIQRAAIDGVYLRAVPNSTEQAVTIRREKIADLMVRVFGPNYGK